MILVGVEFHHAANAWPSISSETVTGVHPDPMDGVGDQIAVSLPLMVSYRWATRRRLRRCQYFWAKPFLAFFARPFASGLLCMVLWIWELTDQKIGTASGVSDSHCV